MIGGLFFIGFGLLMFAFKMYVSYTSHGGAQGGVPVLDGAVFPPIFVVFGVFFWLDIARIDFGWFTYIVIWSVLTGLAFWAINWIGDLGRRRGI